MKSSRTFQFLAAALTCVAFAGLTALAQAPKPDAQAPKGEVKESMAEKGRGGAADPNVKTEKAVNPPEGSKRAAPPNKGGEKSRQLTCDVHIDNRTNLYIQVWVDGNYEGAMGPYGDLYTWAVAGPTQLYARADFDDGSRLTWGPVRVSCPAGYEYTWRIRR